MNAAQIQAEIDELWSEIDYAQRPATNAELRTIKSLLERRDVQRQVEAVSSGMGAPMPGYGNVSAVTGVEPGAAFVASKGFRSISDSNARPQSWSTGKVELPLYGFQKSARPEYKVSGAGTLFEGTGERGAGLIPAPQVIPGVVTTLFEPLSVAAAFASGQTASNSVRYVVEGTATNSAAAVAEGGEKPASDLALSTTDEPVKKIATVLTVSDELMDDVDAVQSYVGGRLQLFVQMREETSILRGGGTNDLEGLIGRTGVNAYARLAADDNTVALAKVIANTRGSSYLEPDTIIMHPTNWLTSRLLRDGTGGTAGQYYGGGPFQGAYGNGGAADTGLFGQSLWGKRVVLSTVVGLGTAVVGSFQQAARIMRRGGMTVEATNSHSDYFVYNLVMIRAESRLALCVFRPSAFTVVSNLT